MAQADTFSPPDPGKGKRLALIALAVLIVLVLAWQAYRFLSDISGVAVQPESPTVVDMLPPPPPPPPPPQEKPPEPQDQAKAEPDPVPQPDKPAPAPMQIDGPAQAGSDAYGMSAGTGTGMGAPAGTGACVGPNCGAKTPTGTDRFWGRNIANALEDHVERSKTVNVDSFVGEFEIWVSEGGALTRARMVRSTGNGKLDQTLVGLLEGARSLKPPPSTIRMPQRIKIGRKRL